MLCIVSLHYVFYTYYELLAEYQRAGIQLDVYLTLFERFVG